VLRLALMVNDVVQHQVHQTSAASISVGTDYRSDLLVSGGRAPERHRLFDVRNGIYYLDVPPHTKGKLRLGSRTLTVGQLRKQYGTKDGLRVALDASAKGKLLVGDGTIAFQFANPKREPLKPPLPALFRESVIGALGMLFIYSQLASTSLLGPLFTWAFFAPIPADEDIEIDERFLIAVGSPQLLKKNQPKIEDEPVVEDTLAQPDETKKAEPKPVEKKLEQPPSTHSERAMSQARNVGLARVLGTYGGDGPGTVFDILGDTENQLGSLFAQGMATTVLADGGPIDTFVAGGEGISLHGDAVETMGLKTGDGPELSNKETKSERKVESKVVSSTQSITGGGNTAALGSQVRRLIRGLKACYEKEMRLNPGVGEGKHTYTIDVSVVGRVTGAVIEEDTLGSKNLATCTIALIKTWRFPMEGAEDDAELIFSVVYSGQ